MGRSAALSPRHAPGGAVHLGGKGILWRAVKGERLRGSLLVRLLRAPERHQAGDLLAARVFTRRVLQAKDQVVLAREQVEGVDRVCTN